MNIYDKAHELAKALRTSPDYQAFLAASKALDTDTEAKKMIKDFLAKQMEYEYEMMAGKPEDNAKKEQVQKLFDLLNYNTRAREFIHAHGRFQRVMADIYKIIGESVAEGLNMFADNK